MSKTTATAVHAAAVVLVISAILPVNAANAAAGGPGDHDHPAPSPAAPSTPGTMEGHAGHGDMGHAGHLPAARSTTAAIGVSDSTRVAVLGGFGAVNAAAVGTALVLRRRGAGRSRARTAR